jgi:hypothetical protein
MIRKKFFVSDATCSKRLSLLHKTGQIKRLRDSVNQEYIYYLKLPKQLKHSLKVTEICVDLSLKYKVIDIKLEPILKAQERQITTIRPDAIIGYVENGINKLGMIEVEISHKNLDIDKYKNFIRLGESKLCGIPCFNLFAYQHESLEIIDYNTLSYFPK